MNDKAALYAMITYAAEEARSLGSPAAEQFLRLAASCLVDRPAVASFDLETDDDRSAPASFPFFRVPISH